MRTHGLVVIVVRALRRFPKGRGYKSQCVFLFINKFNFFRIFSRYFDDCPVIEVPGRTFPVEISHLEDIQKKFNLNLPSCVENCKTDGRPYVNCQEVSYI